MDAVKQTDKRRVSAVAALCALAGFAACAHGAEQATLANGFAQRCDHHAMVDGRVRLYLSAGQESYIDFAPEEITALDVVPDLPVAAAQTPATPSSVPAKLTPADIHEMLTHAGTVHNIDVDLLASLVKAESGGNVRAVSRAGAQGLVQLMPTTAATLGVQDSFQPEQNVRGGSAYLDSLLARYHDNVALALAAYNAGPAAVDKYHGIPPYAETRAYVARVIHEFNRRVLAREAQERRAATAQQAQR